jgi:ribonucleotide reductase beta subunit family protein with ferritin-like domain
LSKHKPTNLMSQASLTAINIFVNIWAMEYEIRYYSEAVQDEILDLPDTLAARYVVLTRRMVALGPNLGEPHTTARVGHCDESIERGEA